MNSSALEIERFDVVELNSEEMKSIEGGHPVVAVVAVIVVVGAALIVGAAVGYALYCLVDWATS
jgi:lactobin A/cerein 7B family class IIb bacteriocin